MLSKKEYLFMFKSFLISFITIWSISKLLMIKINIMQIIFLSMFTMGVLKTIFDFIFKTGSKRVYKYSEKTNQYMRF